MIFNKKTTGLRLLYFDKPAYIWTDLVTESQGLIKLRYKKYRWLGFDTVQA